MTTPLNTALQCARQRLAPTRFWHTSAIAVTSRRAVRRAVERHVGKRQREAPYLLPQPLIAVHDVEASSLWYQRLLNCQSGHGGEEYERLLFAGELILQLHQWDAHVHPHMGEPESKPYGNGVLLWFRTDDFDAAVERARGLDAVIIEEPHVNPKAQHRECWIRDPDGYVVVLASSHGDAG